ncbi:MAG: hypothetical protein R3F54_30990 [Alphaproteobacteria bacterium]
MTRVLRGCGRGIPVIRSQGIAPMPRLHMTRPKAGIDPKTVQGVSRVDAAVVAPKGSIELPGSLDEPAATPNGKAASLPVSLRRRDDALRFGQPVEMKQHVTPSFWSGVDSAGCTDADRLRNGLSASG